MKGVYVLVVELPEPAQVKTKRTAFDLDPGFYAYVGSALNNLEARIMRHLSNEKKRHWHIDYLLDRASVRAVVSAQSDTNAECLIAKGFSIMTQVARFGCSDCRCHSHLFHSLDLDDLKGRAVEAFRLAGLNPRTIKYP